MRIIEREIVGAIIFSNDGYVLLGENHTGGTFQGYKVIPGGGVKEGESLLDALKREVREEVSLDISDAKIEKVNDHYGESEKTLKDTGEKVLVKMHINDFRIDIDKPASEIPAKAADDFAIAEWIPPTQVSSLKLSPTTQATLQKLGCL